MEPNCAGTARVLHWRASCGQKRHPIGPEASVAQWTAKQLWLDWTGSVRWWLALLGCLCGLNTQSFNLHTTQRLSRGRAWEWMKETAKKEAWTQHCAHRLTLLTLVLTIQTKLLLVLISVFSALFDRNAIGKCYSENCGIILTFTDIIYFLLVLHLKQISIPFPCKGYLIYTNVLVFNINWGKLFLYPFVPLQKHNRGMCLLSLWQTDKNTSPKKTPSLPRWPLLPVLVLHKQPVTKQTCGVFAGREWFQ